MINSWHEERTVEIQSKELLLKLAKIFHLAFPCLSCLAAEKDVKGSNHIMFQFDLRSHQMIDGCDWSREFTLYLLPSFTFS